MIYCCNDKSVTNIVSAADAVVKSYTYSAYGNTASTGTFVNSFAYTGAVNDEETGLYYMNARYYDPETGRFISQDTYRGTGEAFWHLYLYCDSDPVNHIDPSGHWLLDAVFLAADVVSFIKKPSLGKALWIVADLLCFLDPSGVASTLAHAGKVAKVAKAAKVLKSKKIVNVAKTVKNTAKETKVVKGVTKAIKAPTNRNGLKSAMKKVGSKPFEGAQAHHGLPWNHKNWFAEKGLNVNDAKFGAWVKGGGNGGHQSWSKAYDKVWENFKKKNPNATAQQIKNFYNKIRKDKKWGGGF